MEKTKNRRSDVQTNLVGRVCTVNPHMLHMWPWATKQGQDHALLVAIGNEPMVDEDVNVKRAEIVAVYVKRESDGSSGVEFLLSALDDNQYKGSLAEACPIWVKLTEER